MALSDEFKNAVDSHDVLLTRIMLKDSMLVDLSLRRFEEQLRYAESNMEDLYDQHDGEAFNEDITTWTEAYLDEQMVNVVSNFSKERVAFLKKLVRNIYSSEADNSDREVFIEEHKKLTTTQKIGAAGMCGGVVVTIAGIATSHPVVAVVGAAVAVAGGVAFIKGKDK